MRSTPIIKRLVVPAVGFNGPVVDKEGIRCKYATHILASGAVILDHKVAYKISYEHFCLTIVKFQRV